MQFEPFIMEDGEKLNLGIRWKKYLTKFEKFLVVMNISEDKRKVAMLLHFGGDYIQDIIDNAVPKVEGYDATVEYLNKHLNPKTSDTFEIYKFQKAIRDRDETIQQFCNRPRSIANRCNFENEDKHIKTQLILGTHSQKLRKFCFTNPAVSLKEVVNRGKLFEEVDKQTGVVEDSKGIKEIKNLEKNEQLLQIRLKSLQEQIIELKSNQKSTPKIQEYINRRTVQKYCFKCGRSRPHRNGECSAKGKICTKCGKPNHFPRVCKSININVVNYEDDSTLEYINGCDIPSSKTSMQNSKVQLQNFIANITIDNVKVRFLIDTGSSANILCYETLNENSKLNMNNYKLKKTSVKLIPFGSNSENSFTSVKGVLSVLLETKEHFANAMFMLLKTT